MTTLAKLVVKLVTDVSEFEAGIQAANKKMTKLGTDMSNVGQKLTTGITLPVVALGAGALKAAADFEQGMSNIKAVSSATGAQMESLTKLAMKMGAETKFSAKEAALGIEELIKAGLSVEQVLDGGLQGALTLAIAGDLALGESAEIAATALNAFKSDALSVAQAADILAGAANASATDVQGLRLALSQVSAVASAVGLSFKDTVTAIALFAQNGLKGSDAGTSLKTMLMNLIPTTKKQIELFSELGLLTAQGTSAFFDQTGKLKSLTEIANLLQTSLKGLTEEQRLAALNTMFGSDAIRAANILYKEGAKGVTDMYAAMSTTTALDTAKTKSDNLNGAIENLKGSVETLGISVGTLLIPPVKDLANWLTGLVNGINELPPGIKEAVVNFALFAASIGPVLWVVGGLIRDIMTIRGLFITGGALAEVGKWFMGLGGLIKEFLIPAVGTAIKALGGLGPIFTTILWPALLLGGAISLLIIVIQNFGPQAIECLQRLPAVFNEAFKRIQKMVGDWAKGVSDKLSEIGPAIMGAIRNAINVVGSWGNALYQFGRDLLAGFVNGILSFATKVVETTRDVVRWTVDAVKKFLGIKSPSKVFRDIGEDMMAGMGEGITVFSINPIQAATKAAEATGDATATEVKSNIDDIKMIIQSSNLAKVFSIAGQDAMTGLASGMYDTAGMPVQAAIDASNEIIKVIPDFREILRGRKAPVEPVEPPMDPKVKKASTPDFRSILRGRRPAGGYTGAGFPGTYNSTIPAASSIQSGGSRQVSVGPINITGDMSPAQKESLSDEIYKMISDNLVSVLEGA